MSKIDPLKWACQRCGLNGCMTIVSARTNYCRCDVCDGRGHSIPMGSIWRSRSGREWKAGDSRYIRVGNVLMSPLGATGFGGVKRRQVDAEGIENRGWKMVSA